MNATNRSSESNDDVMSSNTERSILPLPKNTRLTQGVKR